MKGAFLFLLLLAVYARALQLWDFTVSDGMGNAWSFSELKRVPAVLIVNVASKCGYTDRDYRELQALRAKHSKDKLAIVAFPCNQFGAQEPGTNAEIALFAEHEYGVTFPIMSKVEVNGPEASPLFDWLKAASGSPGDIPWNFSKFLVVCGSKVKRYSHEVSPLQIEGDIEDAPTTCDNDAEEL